MDYYHNDDDHDDDGMIIEVMPNGYRNAIRVRDHRRRHPRPYYHSPRPRPNTQVYVRPSQAQPAQTTPVQQSGSDDSSDPRIALGGLRISLGAMAGTVLTLGGLGVQLASHFISQPEPPEPDGAKAADLAGYAQDKAQADQKVQLLGTIGRALSDLGQLAAGFRNNR